MAKTKTPTLAIASVGEQTGKKRIGRPPADAPPSNVSDDTWREFCAKALRAKADLDAAQTIAKSKNGAYRSVLKDAKKAGVDSAAITWWLAEKAKEPDVLQAEHSARMRVARLMGLPIGAQLGLFEEGEAPDAASTDRGIMQERAYQVGLTAGKAAETFDPARYPNDPDCQERFFQGWTDGQAEHVRALGRGVQATGDAAATA